MELMELNKIQMLQQVIIIWECCINSKVNLDKAKLNLEKSL